MYKIPANTLFLGKSLVYVPQCHSTNTLASELSQKKDTPEGTIVITDDQIAGKGQRGSTWVATPGQNLTVSVVLRPRFLSVRDQFRINRAVSLAVAGYISTKVASSPVTIKWPNDILIGDQKAAGILIENHISASAINASIVGIGVNINQESFPWPKATSLKISTGKDFVLNEELALLLGFLEASYVGLREGKSDEQETRYRDFLYRRGERHRFISNGREWEGEIIGVDDVGRLRVREGENEKTFEIKEIAFA